MKIKSIIAIGAFMALSLVSFKPSDKEVQSEKRFGGLALYTVRDAMKDARATLEKVAQAGYVNVESAGRQWCRSRSARVASASEVATSVCAC